MVVAVDEIKVVADKLEEKFVLPVTVPPDSDKKLPLTDVPVPPNKVVIFVPDKNIVSADIDVPDKFCVYNISIFPILII